MSRVVASALVIFAIIASSLGAATAQVNAPAAEKAAPTSPKASSVQKAIVDRDSIGSSTEPVGSYVRPCKRTPPPKWCNDEPKEDEKK